MRTVKHDVHVPIPIPVIPKPVVLHTVRRLDRVQRTASVVADHLDPATFMILLLDPLAVLVGASLVFVAVGIFGIFLLARMVKVDADRELLNDERSVARKIRDVCAAILLKIELTGKTKGGITAKQATRELDRRDPRHP